VHAICCPEEYSKLEAKQAIGTALFVGHLVPIGHSTHVVQRAREYDPVGQAMGASVVV
jgi:hypothetical protein